MTLLRLQDPDGAFSGEQTPRLGALHDLVHVGCRRFLLALNTAIVLAARAKTLMGETEMAETLDDLPRRAPAF